MRRELVEWRESAGLTPEALALKLGVSTKTVRRLENGETENPRMSLRTQLAAVYGRTVDDVGRAIRGDSNGHSVSNLGLLVSLEQGATDIRWWEPVSMPGLLQTERYALAVESAGPKTRSDSEIERRVALRLQRQRVLDRLTLHAVIDASVLLRETGGPAAMAEQREHLRALTERPNVSIRVVPLDATAHPAGTGPFTILTGGGDFPHTVVTHNALAPQYWDMTPVMQHYESLFSYLWGVAHDLAKVEL